MNSAQQRGSQLRRQRGQGMLEYSLVFLLIVLVVIAALTMIGPAVAQAISGISPAL